jgi:hypothetical protein
MLKEACPGSVVGSVCSGSSPWRACSDRVFLDGVLVVLIKGSGGTLSDDGGVLRCHSRFRGL